MEFDDILLEIMDKLAEGKEINIDEYCNKYPQYKDKLLSKLRTAEFLKKNLQEEDFTGRKFGEYIILQELGRGGMGVVYLAIQPALSRLVVIKILPPSFAYDEEALKNFQEEAKIIAKFTHPNIVPVYSFGDEGGIKYIAMNYIAGSSLKNILEKLEKLENRKNLKASVIRDMLQIKPVEKQEVTQQSITVKRGLTFWNKSYYQFVAIIGAEIAEAINYAHQSGICHGDIKPSNIILTHEAIPMVVDFGLSKDVKKLATSKPKEFTGTLAYAAPEQIKENTINEKTDIWALGVTLYELLTFRKPFIDETVEKTANKILKTDSLLLRSINKNISVELEAITLKCLDKNPNNRYNTAQELFQDLNNYLELKPTKAKPVKALGRLYKTTKRHPHFTAFWSIIFIVILISSFFIYKKQINSLAALGWALETKGDVEMAYSAYNKGLMLSPQIPLLLKERKTMLQGLSRIFVITQQHDKTIEYCKKILEIDSQNADVLGTMASSYYFLGRQQKNSDYYISALKTAEQALLIRPNYLFAIRTYSTALFHLNRTSEAFDFLVQKCKTPEIANDLGIQKFIALLLDPLLNEAPHDEIKEVLVSKGFSKDLADNIINSYFVLKKHEFNDLKFSFSCPPDWEVKKVSGVYDAVLEGLVVVYLPEETTRDGFRATITIGLKANNKLPIITNLKNYFESSLKTFDNNPQYPDFKLLKKEKIKYAGRGAYKSIYSNTLLGSTTELKSFQIYIESSKKETHVITFVAQKEVYEAYADKVNKIMKSFHIILRPKGIRKAFDKATKKNVYTNSYFNFAFAYPQDWEVSEMSGIPYFRPKSETENNNFFTNVTILFEDFENNPIALDEYTSTRFDIFSKTAENVKLIEKSKTSLNNIEARSLIYEAGPNTKFKSYLFVKDYKVHIITYGAEKEDYDKYLPQAEDIMQSFRSL